MRSLFSGLSISLGAALLLGGPAAIAGDTNPPPGPVTGTMKTLDEVEPRVAVQSLAGNAGATHIIITSGSYYLTADIIGEVGKDGILIDADNVTIDLAGFALLGVPGSINGIDTNGTVINIAVRNGSVQSWGNDGVRLTSASNSTMVDLRSSGNLGNGLRIGDGATVTRCVAEFNDGTGILADRGSVVTECVSRSNKQHGFSAGTRAVVRSCAADDNSETGFSLGGGAMITGCNAAGNLTGIGAISNATVQGNTSYWNAGAGILATGDDNTIEGNTITRSGIGLDINGADNTIAGNIVKGNTDNYDIAQEQNHINVLLCEIPETIDWPANVTLAGSLRGVLGEHGITINSDGVTIDLGGHELVGVAGSFSGVFIPTPLDHFAIRNGVIRDWGNSGFYGPDTSDLRFEDLIVADNVDWGIAAGSNMRMIDCQLDGNGNQGVNCSVYANISGSTATNNGQAGFRIGNNSILVGCNSSINSSGFDLSFADGVVLRDCIAQNNIGSGVSSANDAEISGCSANGNGGHGIHAASNTRIVDCHVLENSHEGISVTSSCFIANNLVKGNEMAGIHAAQNRNRIDSNHVLFNDIGIDIDGENNILLRNTASGNTTSDYDLAIPANNSFGPIVNVFWSGDISLFPGADSPWVNLSH